MKVEIVYKPHMKMNPSVFEGGQLKLGYGFIILTWPDGSEQGINASDVLSWRVYS